MSRQPEIEGKQKAAVSPFSVAKRLGRLITGAEDELLYVRSSR